MTANPLSIIRDYLATIERRGDASAFFTEDVVQREFPNRLVPNGATRNLQALREAAERGRKVMTSERYEILNAIVQGDRVAIEAQWIGTASVPVGTIPPGGEMKARFGVFFELRDGKIARQHNYDCFDPF